MLKEKLLLLFVVNIAFVCSLLGQINISVGNTYTQDFDGLANTGSANTTMPSGWSFTETDTNADGNYAADSGSGTGGNTYSYGATNASDRAIGELTSGSLLSRFGAQFNNNGPQTISQVTMTATGEQWRRGSSTTDALTFEFSTNAISLTTGTWTSVSGLTFNSVNNSGSGASLDGNASGNQASLSGTLTFSPRLAINGKFWIRWIASDATGADHGMAIDNFAITSVLPIELSTFNTKATQSTITLSFTTATERNNSHFNIERSADGRSFEKIGEVRGAGNSVTEQQYTFTDEKPLQGMNYYRLEQVDFDGQSSYSPVRSVVFGKSGAVLLYPAPVASALNVRLDEAFEQDADWQMLDMAGRAVGQGEFAAEQTEFSLPVGHLPEGGYVLRITSGQRVLTQQFRKQ